MTIPPYADLSQISDVTKRYVAQTQGILDNTGYDTRFNNLVDAVAKRIAFMVDTSQAEGEILNLKKLIDTLGE